MTFTLALLAINLSNENVQKLIIKRKLFFIGRYCCYSTKLIKLYNIDSNSYEKKLQLLYNIFYAYANNKIKNV